MTSSLPAFKAALLARLTTAFATAGEDGEPLFVSWGNPHPDRMPAEVVIIGETKNRTLEYVASMAQANERYEVEVLVSIVGPVQSANADLLTRAWAVADLVEDSVLAARLETAPFGSAVLVCTPGVAHDVEAVTSDKREASVMLTLSVIARI